MRIPALVLIACAAGSCTTGPQQPVQLTPHEQAELARLTEGKVAGPPTSCLQHYNSNDMITVNESTVAFRQGRGRVWLNNMQGGCPNLRPPYALVTRQFGSAQLCRGDIAQVIDTSTGITVGSCVFGDFVPYAKPGYSY